MSVLTQYIAILNAGFVNFGIESDLGDGPDCNTVNQNGEHIREYLQKAGFVQTFKMFTKTDEPFEREYWEKDGLRVWWPKDREAGPFADNSWKLYRTNN